MNLVGSRSSTIKIIITTALIVIVILGGYLGLSYFTGQPDKPTSSPQPSAYTQTSFRGIDIVQTNEGGYAIIGETSNDDILFVKTDELGNVNWTKTYQAKTAESLIQTSDGGYAIAGYSDGFFLLKTDASGEVVWEKTYTDGDFGYSVIQSSDGGYVIAGYKVLYDAGHPAPHLLKTDSEGNILWNTTYSELSNLTYDVIESSGGYVFVGTTSLCKTDASGNLIWSKSLQSSAGLTYCSSVIQSSDGGYVIAGHYGTLDSDVYVVKTDSFGNMQWNKTYGGTCDDEYLRGYQQGGKDIGESIVQSPEGGYLVAGFTKSFGAGQFDLYLVKINSNGKMLWNKTYGGALDDFGKSVICSSDGGYTIVGYTESFGSEGLFEIYILKIDASGNTQWFKTFNEKIVS